MLLATIPIGQISVICSLFFNTSEVVKAFVRFFDNYSEGVEKAVTEAGRLHPDLIRSFYEKATDLFYDRFSLVLRQLFVL